MLIIENQKRLAKKVLEQPNRPLDNLYRYVSDPFWLATAVDSVKSNAGSKTAGVDGVNAKQIENIYAYAKELSEDLKNRSYTPSPVRRVYIPKSNGKLRPLGIPTIRDRVVQESLRMVLEPIMESKFLDCSTGFRPSRRTMDAIHLTSLYANMWWVVEGDIKACFDEIPHKKLMGVLKQHIKCRKSLRLIEAFLKAGIIENGKVSKLNRGVPQGGIVSPLLANIYLHEMDMHWWNKYGSLTAGQKSYRRTKGMGNVQLLRYADDFVLLTNGNKQFAHDLKDEFGRFLRDRLGLELNSEKTLVTHMDDGYDFLGFNIKRVYSKQSAKKITLVTPSQRNVEKFKEKIREITDRSTTGDDPVNKLRAINAIVTGWANYYRHVNFVDIRNELSWYTHNRFYYWLKYVHSNVSAKGSIGKYVINKYMARNPKGWRLYKVHGVWEKPMYSVKLKRYRINWPKTGNPYLAEEDISLSYREETPLPNKIWSGTSPQRKWAVARMERLAKAGYKCEQCESSDELEAHHVIARKDGGHHTVNNLRVLCKSCHDQVHKG